MLTYFISLAITLITKAYSVILFTINRNKIPLTNNPSVPKYVSVCDIFHITGILRFCNSEFTCSLFVKMNVRAIQLKLSFSSVKNDVLNYLYSKFEHICQQIIQLYRIL